jgi:hypothetical protein
MNGGTSLFIDLYSRRVRAFYTSLTRAPCTRITLIRYSRVSLIATRASRKEADGASNARASCVGGDRTKSGDLFGACDALRFGALHRLDFCDYIDGHVLHVNLETE